MVPPYFASTAATQSFLMMAPQGVLFGAVRSPDEPCSVCTQNALNSTGDEAIVQRFATFLSQPSFPKDPINIDELQTLLREILIFVQSTSLAMNLITFPTIYYGNQATGSSYLVKDCYRWTSECPLHTNTRYMAWVANVALYSNLTRQLYAFDSQNFTFVGTSDVYNVSARPWFQGKFGWTGTFGACKLKTWFMMR